VDKFADINSFNPPSFFEDEFPRDSMETCNSRIPFLRFAEPDQFQVTLIVIGSIQSSIGFAPQPVGVQD
jgi:hypothetical protein